MKQILITILIFISFKTFSQTDSTPSHKILSLNLTQFVLPEMRLTYEHSINNKINLAYSAGFRFHQKNTQSIYSAVGSTYMGFTLLTNQHYSGIYTSVMPKLSILNYETVLLCLELYNNLLWFNKRHAIHENDEKTSENFNAIRSERVNSTGLKLLVEKTIYAKEGFLKHKLSLSFYCGIGGLFRYYQFESSNGTLRDMPIVGVVKEKGQLFRPSIHVGAKLNFHLR